MGAKARPKHEKIKTSAVSPLVASFGMAAVPFVLLISHEHLSMPSALRSVRGIIEFSKDFFKYGGINIVAAVYQLFYRLFAKKKAKYNIGGWIGRYFF